MNYMDRLNSRSVQPLDLLASAGSGIDCDLLSAYAESNQRLRSCFRIPFHVQADPFWGNFNLDWPGIELTEENRRLFNQPWRVTQALWERPDGLIQNGLWQIGLVNGMEAFEWLPYNKVARVYRLGGISRIPLPPWNDVMLGARLFFLEWQKTSALIRRRRILAGHDATEYDALEATWHDSGGDLDAREAAYTQSVAILKGLANGV